ncbi:MAG TPA: superoxide dismutase family protein [Longimicrobiales bacterium]
MKRTATAALAALTIAACDNTADNENDLEAMDTARIVETTPAGGQRATATLQDSTGTQVGTVTLTASADSGVAIAAQVRGVAPGEHGIHVHMVGQCDPATGFESAGAHLNPTNMQHGLENPNGPHLGDMPNLTVANDSTGTVSFTNAQLRLGQGGNLLDADGAAIVVHASADDQRTDPSGNSGARVACGVVDPMR